MSEDRYIVEVAGPIGSGKSTVVNLLANQLPDARAIYFDHYEQFTESPAHSFLQDLEHNAAVDRFAVPQWVEHLAQLKRGESIVNPATGETIEPGKFVVAECPLGRQIKELTDEVDFLVWIDVPLDVALARKAKEFVSSVGSDSRECADFIGWFDEYLENYLDTTRNLLLWQEAVIKPDANACFDGMFPPDELCLKIKHELFRSLGM